MVIRSFEVNGQFFNSGQPLTENQYNSIPPNLKGYISENTVIEGKSPDKDDFGSPILRSKNSLKRR